MKKERLALAVILLLALAIRLYPVMANLPHTYWHDENNYIESALRFGSGNFKLTTFAHGALLQIALFAAYAIYGAVSMLLGQVHSAREFYLAFLKDPTPFFVIARLITMLCGAGTAWLTYLIAAEIYNSRVGIIAAAFAGFSLIMVQMSSVGLADIPALLIQLSAFLALTHSIKKPDDDRIFYAACILSGLATACKYTSVVMIVPVYAAVLIRAAGSGKSVGYLFRGIVSASLVTFAGFLIGMPFFALNAFGVINDTFVKLTDEYILKNAYPNTWLFYITNHLRNGLGLPLECVSLAGVAYALYKRSKWDILILSFSAAYYLLVMNSVGYAYHTLPAIPFLLILGARLCDATIRRFTGKDPVILSLALAAVIVLPSASDAVKYVSITMARDTRTEAKAWIEKNIPIGATIVSEGYISGEPVHGPPLTGNLDTLKRDLRFVILRGGSGIPSAMKIENFDALYGGATAYDIFKTDQLSRAAIDSKDPEYVILSGAVDAGTGEELYATYFDKGYAVRRKELRGYISAHYVLVRSFQPTDGFLPSFPHLLDQDYCLLRKIRFSGLRGYVKGPRIDIFKARRVGGS